MNSYARIFTVAAYGLGGIAIEVECQQSVGLPAFQIVGLPNASVREARDRVESALESAGFPLPSRRIVVNLAPAWLKKEGTGFDLAIAIACLSAAGVVPKTATEGILFWGELTLGGKIKAVDTGGTLERLLREGEYSGAVVAREQSESLLYGSGRVGGGYEDLAALILDLQKNNLGVVRLSHSNSSRKSPSNLEMPEQLPALMQRMLWIAAAGEHHLLVWGPRGVGKTFAANILAEIMPSPSPNDLELVHICHHRRGLRPPERIPFRSLHSSTSRAGLLGCGTTGMPGELSLANGGLLFIDELLEYKRETLESLRQVMESGQISFSRAQQNILWPARCLVYAATNPCPCGEAGDARRVCRCPVGVIRTYRRRLSAALADRFDLWWGWQANNETKISSLPSDWAQRIQSAREQMLARQGYANGRLQGEFLEKSAALSPAGRQEIQLLAREYGMRSRHAVLKIAHTLADLEGSREVGAAHVQEAIFYRMRPLFD